MNRLEEYLNSIEKKQLYMLYISILIAVGVLYYNFNYSFLQNKINTQTSKISVLENKLKKTNYLELKLIKIKNQIKKLKKENSGLSEDLNYVNILITSSNILNINDKKFPDILKNVLNEAVNNNIQASYTINKNLTNFKTYNIDINGTFTPKQYYDFAYFIKNLEDINGIKEIKNFSLKKDRKVKFHISIIFWSLL